MFELVQVTAQYSNAVLIAIIPYLTDFARKLDLPLDTPLTPAMVQHFKCDARKGHVGGLVMLTNLTQFTFLDGRVCIYRSPASYYSLQDPERIPQFYGNVKISQAAALQIARGTIRKMGYEQTLFRAELPPKITPPVKIRDHVVPRYRFLWLDSNWRTSGASTSAALDVEVNASNGQVEMLALHGHLTERPGPKMDVEPPLSQASNTSETQSEPGRNTDPVSKEFARAFLEAILPQVSDFILRAGLPLPTPVTTNQVDMSQLFCAIYQGQPIAQLYLTNGDRFNYERGHVVVFDAHDAFFHNQKQGTLEHFLGKQNLSTNDAVALAKRVFEKLGYKEKPPRTSSYGPDHFGTNIFTPYDVRLLRTWDNSEIARFEIDLGDKAIKSIYLDDPSLDRPSPKVVVPNSESLPENH